MYKILKINIQETKLKYVILHESKVSAFVSWLNKKNVLSSDISVSLGNISTTSFPVIEKYCLFDIDSWKSILTEIESKGFVQLKKNIEKFISWMFHEKEFLILEPKYNDFIEDKGLDKLFQSKEDIKKFINHYFIMSEYFKVLKSDKVWIHYIIKNDVIYVRFESFTYNRNEIKSFNKNKKLLKLSNSNFVPFPEYSELIGITLWKNYKSIRDLFEVLNNQESKKDKLVSNFFNYFIKYIYWDIWKEKKVELLNLIPSYKNYAYKKTVGKEYYMVVDKTLEVYINYNKTLFFYKLLKKLVELVLVWNEGWFNVFMKNYKDFIISYIKNNNFEKMFSKNVFNNIDYIEKNYKDYILWIKEIISKNPNISKEDILKELKNLNIEKKNNFNVYGGYDLWTINNSKQISKILKIFKSAEYNEM